MQLSYEESETKNTETDKEVKNAEMQEVRDRDTLTKHL